jgi:hypothetical protein
MTQPAHVSPQGDGAIDFYWIGVYLSDGSFMQAGYADNYPGCGALEWFVQVYGPTGTQLQATTGQCGITGARSFSVNNRSPYGWWGEASGIGLIGNEYNDPEASSTGDIAPYAVSELSVSGNKLPASTDVIAGVEYHVALGYSGCGCGGYTDAATATLYSFNRVCEHEEVFNDMIFDEFRAGTVYMSGCWADGRTLWG